MALSYLPNLENLRFLPSVAKIRNPNYNFSVYFHSPYQKSAQSFPVLKCSAANDLKQFQHPKPHEIPWSKELANTVQLIGFVGAPVQLKQLSSGKVVAWTRIGVRKSALESSWVNLTFWDDLAHVASQHLVKGHQVYVSGRLVSETVEVDDGKQQVYYKVVVQKLNFIERTYPAVKLYDSEPNQYSSGGKFSSNAGNSSGSIEELWQAFFANPTDWWDNRDNKRNPKYPDFKHKDTGEALWIEGKFNPTWVKSQLAVLDTRMSMHTNENSSTTSDLASLL